MTACKVKTGDGNGTRGGRTAKEQADKAPEAVPVGRQGGAPFDRGELHGHRAAGGGERRWLPRRPASRWRCWPTSASRCAPARCWSASTAIAPPAGRPERGQVRKLEANYRRATQLAGQQMVSANDVDQLRYDLENARGRIAWPA